MFQKINYLSLVLLMAILAFMFYKDGWSQWKKAPRRNFSVMAAQAGISDAEREKMIKERYGSIQELIDTNQLEKALLSLRQKEADYNTDAHFYFLQGEIYAEMKLYQEASSNFLKAIKYDSNYAKGPKKEKLEPREFLDDSPDVHFFRLIQNITLEALEFYKGKDDPSSKEALKVVYALQRRLAGGCE